VSRAKLSAAVEDYLKAIYLLVEEGAPVTTASLAVRLGVAAPSVTNMLKRLNATGLVVHSPYRDIELTPAGRAVAIEIVRHHRLLELYLSEFLDIPWDKVHDEAERLEHVISEDLETRMAEKLGQPSVDPHGHPIPTYEGAVDDRPTVPLWDVMPGDTVVIDRVSDRDPGLLNFLPTLKLVPGAAVEILDISPYGGTQTIRVGDEMHVLGIQLARNIRVRARSPEAAPGIPRQ
jgi:DtxR family Mn-dependent transcriptional regulator